LSAERRSELVVGVLGMPDNEATARLLTSLTRDAGLHVQFVVYWTPSTRQQWRRLVRKVKRDGIGAAVRRIVYAARARGGPAGAGTTGGAGRSWREHYVPGHNSSECEAVLREEGVDVLILSTDAIISSRILAVPRLVTLNAHPGWLPRYRGLGSNLVQMQRGEWPAVSVHAVDEGIDTGPVIVRERVQVDPRRGLDDIEDRVEQRRRQLLGTVVKEIQDGGVRYIDTFCEPSNLARGVSFRDRRRLDRLLRSGRLTLGPARGGGGAP
jgi:folate-dependent phosphoribosylglycinamide formyltransferase PurN